MLYYQMTGAEGRRTVQLGATAQRRRLALGHRARGSLRGCAVHPTRIDQRDVNGVGRSVQGRATVVPGGS